MRNVWNKSIAKLRLALLLPLSCVLLLACATDGDKLIENKEVIYVYPPASLLRVNPDPTKPTAAELLGPDGDKIAARYILAWELEGMTRGQAIRCIEEWKRIHQATASGQRPESPPAYCVFEE